MGPVEILKFLKRHDCFPNATIAYRVLLTIPVTVASAERSFSKLKLLKSYLCSTMIQERLNDLTMIALESDILPPFLFLGRMGGYTRYQDSGGYTRPACTSN